MSNQLTAIEVNNQQKIFTVLLNVLKMLSARELINPNTIQDKYEKIKNIFSDDQIYNIKTDKGNNFVLKFAPQKITTINKALGVSDFLTNYKNDNKIVVVVDINKKAYKQIIEFPNTEIFWEFEFMMNLIDHVYIPEHTLLPIGYQPSNMDPEEKYKDHEKLEDIYFVTKRECPKIEVTDPIARYYNLIPGQFIRIKRKSMSSGYSPSYRIVVNAPISRLFDRFS